MQKKKKKEKFTFTIFFINERLKKEDVIRKRIVNMFIAMNNGIS